MAMANVHNPNSLDTIVASSARTASASGGAASGYSAAHELMVQLEVTAASGTTPTFTFAVKTFCKA